MKNLKILIFFFSMNSFCFGQNKGELQSGVSASMVKFTNTNYAIKSAYFDELGQIEINKPRQTSFTSDLDFWVQQLRKKHYTRIQIGITADERVLNTHGAIDLLGFNDRAVIDRHYSVTTSINYGYLVYGKRSIHVFLQGGITVKVFTIGSDINPINFAVKSITRDQVILDLFGPNYYSRLDQQYNFPNLRVSGGLHMIFQRFGLNIIYAAENKSFSFFQKHNEYLYSSMAQFKLELSYLIHSSNLGNGN